MASAQIFPHLWIICIWSGKQANSESYIWKCGLEISTFCAHHRSQRASYVYSSSIFHKPSTMKANNWSSQGNDVKTEILRFPDVNHKNSSSLLKCRNIHLLSSFYFIKTTPNHSVLSMLQVPLSGFIKPHILIKEIDKIGGEYFVFAIVGKFDN